MRGLMLGWMNHIEPTSGTQRLQCVRGNSDLRGTISVTSGLSVVVSTSMKAERETTDFADGTDMQRDGCQFPDAPFPLLYNAVKKGLDYTNVIWEYTIVRGDVL